MGKRNTKWGPQTQMRYAREGRGTGSGRDYVPQILTHDFPSKGKVARVYGHTTERIHHLLSQLEKYFFLCLDFDPAVSDTREQFPLELKKTLLIAADLGYKHPESNGWPSVMTTDFYFCRNGVWQAVAVKPSDEVSKKRVAEKLEIERVYWEREGIDWEVKTELDINLDEADNILWLRHGAPLTEIITDKHQRESVCDVFCELYEKRHIPFETIIEGIERECHLPPGAGLQIFKHLVMERRISIDLEVPIDHHEPRREVSRMPSRRRRRTDVK